MKLYSILLCAVAAAAVSMAQTNETVVRVTGDRVSLRARPVISSDLLERAMRGDEMIYRGASNGWVAVQAPDSLNYWVAGQYISGGVVQPEKLNIRSGPSLNYTVVGILNQGDVVSARGEFNDWLKIAPPQGCEVWISEKYVELIEPPKPELVPLPIAESVPVEEPLRKVEAPVEVMQVAESVEPDAPASEAVAVPEPVEVEAPKVVKDEPVVVEPEVVIPPKKKLQPLVLVMDKSRAQGTYDEIPGVLREANPGLYQLVLLMDGFEEPICLVRGKEGQLKRYLNRAMLIKGRKYWAKGVDLPVLQPEKIHLDPILED